jgi:1-acyl-sn-glycerol-3-phosphate acyltransferase
MYGAAMFLQRLWAKWLLMFSFVKPQITFENKLNNPPYIYCANHSSALDVILMYVTVKENFHFVAKKEHSDTPLWGVMFGKTHITVKRESMTDSFLAMKKAAEDLKRGISIVIFPEGTMNNTEEKLLPFKSGAFKLACDADVAVVPVSFIDNKTRLPQLYKVLYPKGSPGRARIFIHQPIHPKEANKNPKELSKMVFKKIESKL